MTPEQEKILVDTVERLTVLVQLIDWQALNKRSTDAAGELNNRLCDTFPWLLEEKSSVDV